MDNCEVNKCCGNPDTCDRNYCPGDEYDMSKPSIKELEDSIKEIEDTVKFYQDELARAKSEKAEEEMQECMEKAMNSLRKECVIRLAKDIFEVNMDSVCLEIKPVMLVKEAFEAAKEWYKQVDELMGK
jgi:sugar-specific transcriptional regulator TrmB